MKCEDDCWRDCKVLDSWRDFGLKESETTEKLKQEKHDLEVMVGTLMYVLGVRP